MPPAWSELRDILWPTLETIDMAIFGTVFGVIMAVPLAVMAAATSRRRGRSISWRAGSSR